MITNFMLILTVAIIAMVQLRTSNDNKPVSRKELLSISILLFSLTLAFLGLTGVLTSGYHFIDDHEVYVWGNKLSKEGFFSALAAIVKNDLNTRYRITYMVVRVIQCYIFKDNFLVWQIFYVIVSAASLFLAYYYSRIRGSNILASFVFATAIYLGGDQISVTWRLGPQENLCTLYLFITLLVLHQYYKKRSLYHLILAIFATLFLSGSKEAFLLLLPTLPFILVYWDMEDSNDYSVKNLFALTRKYIVYVCSTFIIFAAGILTIYLAVGTNQIGYAGVDSGFNLLDYLYGIYWIIRGDIFPYLLLSIVAFSLSIYYQKDNLRKFFNVSIWPVALFVINLALQFVLHAKSGMYERYLLPTAIILAYFSIIYCGKYINRTIPIFTAFALILFLSNNNQDDAQQYAQDGVNTTALLNKVNELYINGDNILVDLGYEKDFSAEAFLEEKYGISTVYNVNHSPSDNGLFYDSYHQSTVESTPISLDEADIIIRYKNNSEEILQIDNLDSDFTLYEFGRYLLYVK